MKNNLHICYSKLIWLLAISFILNADLHAQRNVDSLNALLQKTSNDTVKLNLYLQLVDVCEPKDNLKYGSAGIQLADRLLKNASTKKERQKIAGKKALFFNYIVFYYREMKDTASVRKTLEKWLQTIKLSNDFAGTNSVYRELSGYYYVYDNFPKAMEYLDKAMHYARQHGDSEGMAACYRIYARYFEEQDDLPHALSYSEKALEIARKAGTPVELANDLIAVGFGNGKLKKYSKSKTYFDQALKLSEKMNEQQKLETQRFLYNVMGLMYSFNNINDSAIFYFEKALPIAEKIGVKSWVRGILSNLGGAYRNLQNLDKALDLHFKALEAAKETGRMDQLPWSYYNLSIDYYKLRKFNEAKRYNDMNLEMLGEFNYLKGALIDAEFLASQIDSASGNHKGAFYHYHKYIELRDKFKSEELAKVATRDKFQAEYDKKKAEDRVKQYKKDLLAKNEMNRQKMVRNVFIGGFVVVLLLVFIVLKSYREKKKSNAELSLKNKEIEHQNKEIMDSIRYAKRIQSSLLPTHKYIQRILSKNK